MGDLEKHPWNKLQRKSKADPTVQQCYKVHVYSSFSLHVFLQDDMQRRIIWEDNNQKIEDHNQGFLMGRRSFTMAMNKYGDLVRSVDLLCSWFSSSDLVNNQ